MDIEPLARSVLAGDRRMLARAITLVESTRPDHRAASEALVARILPATGKAVRVGLSGAPGVGKSTFIEAFGTHLTGLGRRVAVLAIDPSSSRTGGSILGDKTRMEKLSRDPGAFIRPSPAGTTLGGVARRTREALLLVEAAGFDTVLVETVGVGQSETAVADMTDIFLLLIAPGGGDDLQGIKRGIMELADLVIVNKADGDLLPAARRAEADHAHALRLMRPKVPEWTATALSVSAVCGTGLEAVWAAVEEHHAILTASGSLARQRAAQARAWLWSEIRDGLLDAFRANPAVQAALSETEARVTAGTEAPGPAARQLLAKFHPV